MNKWKHTQIFVLTLIMHSSAEKVKFNKKYFFEYVNKKYFDRNLSYPEPLVINTSLYILYFFIRIIN
jgi:hypothetical protein